MLVLLKYACISSFLLRTFRKSEIRPFSFASLLVSRGFFLHSLIPYGAEVDWLSTAGGRAAGRPVGRANKRSVGPSVNPSVRPSVGRSLARCSMDGPRREI